MRVDGEHNDEEQRQPEVRDGDAETGAHGDQAVAGGAVADPGDDPRRDADEDRQDHAADGEGEGDREACGNAGGDRLALVEQRGSEVTMENPVEPTQILPPERLVQMQLTGYFRHLLGTGVNPTCEGQAPGPRAG